ncbi:acyltransferase family protein [Flavobacterium crocinum]|nr:acyltransferase [Flavobacterium crocinum]
MRVEQLTFTRFIAAVLIVIFHYGEKSFLFNNPYLEFITKSSAVFVSYFFMLSGFVMIIAYHDKTKVSAFEYLKNRLARIYPLYLLGVLLVLVVLILNNKANWGDFLLNVTMIQSWVPEKALTINTPGWSLSVEMFFYVLFPFLFNVIYNKVSFKKISILILVFWIVSQIVFQIMFLKPIMNFPLSIKDLSYFPLLHLNEFLIGNLAAIYYINNCGYQRNFDLAILIVIILIIIALKFPTGFNYHNGLLAVLFIPLILLLSLNTGKLTTILRNRTLVFLGEISFGIYLLQYPVWLWVSDYRLRKYFQLDLKEDPTLAFLVRFVILFLAACLSYKFFELPSRNKIKDIKA